MPKLRGELMSTSEVRRLAGGEEMRGKPGLEGSREAAGERTRLLEVGGADASMCSDDGGEVTLSATWWGPSR